MKVTIYTLTLEVWDRLETSVHNTEAEAMKCLREDFSANAGIWTENGDGFEQEELDALSDSEFLDTLNDHDVSTVIESHELEVGHTP